MDSNEYKKPNVLVAGFPRSGSTFLYHLLTQHPEIYIPKIKEINYFNKDHFFLGNPEIINPRYFKSKKWYYDFFKTNKGVVMDFSILSALDISSAERVKKELGDIKIIFITRNKEDFNKSVWSTMSKWNEIYSDYKEYSNFDHYIGIYKRYFSKVYVLSLEGLNSGKNSELEKLTDFLNVQNYKFDFDVSKHESKHEKGKIGLFQYSRRKIYVNLVKLFYHLSSSTVISLAKAENSKK
ncbi:hypothetical protein HOA59_02170 [archaeon]|nr:hypothetical protein [archaeon]MBT6824221.1 hypothetical protein [archaeon]MBT7106759.1 hypothetical protein [archaeon]